MLGLPACSTRLPSRSLVHFVNVLIMEAKAPAQYTCVTLDVIAGKKSLAMSAYARALRALPATICDNAGLDRWVQAPPALPATICGNTGLDR
eukprot:scaffold307588_cov22-Tisochrysis_lutea.AAC.1